jgi:hypothetical protein
MELSLVGEIFKTVRQKRRNTHQKIIAKRTGWLGWLVLQNYYYIHLEMDQQKLTFGFS